MVKINLLPDVVLERRKRSRIKWIANASLVGWCGLVLMVLLLAFGYNQWQSNQLEQAQSRRDEVESEANSPENVAFRQEALSVQSSLNALEQLRDQRQSGATFINTLADNTPRNIRIANLNYETDDTISIGGRAPSYKAVSTFVHTLKETGSSGDGESGGDNNGYFTGTSLVGANIAGEGVMRFQITTDYVAPGSAATSTGRNTTQGGNSE